MSQQKTCPFCRRVIRAKDKYCPFCGRYVIEATPSQAVHTPVSSPSQPSPMPPPGTYPSQMPPPTAPQPSTVPPSPTAPQPAPVKEEPKEPEELSEEIIDQIALRVELKQLDKSMSEIRNKLEELGETISKMEVTTEIELKIKDFKEEIKTIKAKREKLNLEKRDLPFEEDLIQKKEIKERLKNLNEAYRSKQVTESAFKKLRDEYEKNLREIDNKSNIFKAKINTWIKKLKADEKQIQEKIELNEARHAAGELNQDEFEEQMEEANKKLKQYTNVLKYLSGKI